MGLFEASMFDNKLVVGVDKEVVLDLNGLMDWFMEPREPPKVFDLEFPKEMLSIYGLTSVPIYLDGIKVPFIYYWSTGPEMFNGAIFFSVPKIGLRLTICYGERKAYGAPQRKRVMVIARKVRKIEKGEIMRHGSTRVAVEFVGSDNYENDRTLVAVLKKPGSQSRYLPDEDVIEELKPFEAPFEHRHYIRGGENRKAVILKINDTKNILKYALTRLIIDEYI